MSVNGKRKGSAYERWVCKQLSLWVSKGKAEDLFWRSAMSGGRATVAHKTGKLLRRQAGDITATAPEGHALTDKFYVECKHVRNLSLEAFLLKKTGPLAGFWRTAVKEADRHDKYAMIIARQNRTPDLVFVEAFSAVPAVPLFRAYAWDCDCFLLADLLAISTWFGAS